MQQTNLPGVTPIMIGQGGARPDLNPAMQPQQAMVLPTAGELAGGHVEPLPLPVAPAAVAPAPVALPTAPVGVQSSVNASVVLKTQAVIELPWGFIKDGFDYAFLSPLGEICISDLPPQLVDGQAWQLMQGAECLVLGTYPDTTHWRESLTMRPVVEEAAPEAYVGTEPVVEAEPVHVPVVETSISQAWFDALSNNAKKKHKRVMREKGLDYLGSPLAD